MIRQSNKKYTCSNCDKGTDTINKIKEFEGVLCNECIVIAFGNLEFNNQIKKPHAKQNKKPQAQ